jgi:hypothetical protein
LFAAVEQPHRSSSRAQDSENEPAEERKGVLHIRRIGVDLWKERPSSRKDYDHQRPTDREGHAELTGERVQENRQRDATHDPTGLYQPIEAYMILRLLRAKSFIEQIRMRAGAGKL